MARCAAGLRTSGAAPESGVALVLKNSPEFVFTYLAASRLGAPACFVDSGSKASEFRRLFTENQVAVAVCESEQLLPIEQAREATGQRFSIYSRGGNFADLMGTATEPPPCQTYRMKSPSCSTRQELQGYPNAPHGRIVTWRARPETLT